MFFFFIRLDFFSLSIEIFSSINFPEKTRHNLIFHDCKRAITQLVQQTAPEKLSICLSGMELDISHLAQK